MVLMQRRHESIDEETGLERELLRVREDLLGPIEIVVVGDHHNAFTCVAYGFHAAPHKDANACTFIAGTPWRVCIEAVEVTRIRKRVDAVVLRRLELLEPFLVCEPCDRSADSAI